MNDLHPIAMAERALALAFYGRYGSMPGSGDLKDYDFGKCKNGHVRLIHTYVDNHGHKQCRMCKREWKEKAKARKRLKDQNPLSAVPASAGDVG